MQPSSRSAVNRVRRFGFRFTTPLRPPDHLSVSDRESRPGLVHLQGLAVEPALAGIPREPPLTPSSLSGIWNLRVASSPSTKTHEIQSIDGLSSPDNGFATRAGCGPHSRAAAPPPELAKVGQGFGHEVHRTMFGEGLPTATGVLKDYDRTPRLRELRLPVLFTAGQYDDSTPAEHAWYQSLVPGARLEIIEGAGHLTTLDQPERYTETVREFLRSVEAMK